MLGVRDVNVFPLYGQRKNTGDVGAPFFPGNGIATYVAAVGADGGDYTTAILGTKGYGVTGTASGVGSGAIATGNAITQTAVVLNTNATTTVSVASGTLTASALPVYNFPGAVTVPAAGSTTFTGATVTGTTLSSTATDTGQALAGVNTVVLTGTSTGIVAGTYVQIDVNNVSSATTAEIRKVTNVATATNTTLTLDYPLFFAHAVGAAVIGVTGPYSHTVLPSNTLPSLTIEKNIGGYQSIQFTGSRIDKYGLKIETSDAPIAFSAGVTAQSFQILGGVNSATINAAASNSAKTQVTYTTTAPHGYNVGQQVTVASVTSSGGVGTFNVTDVILSVPTATTFVLANTTTATYTSGGSVSSTLTPITVANELPFVFSEAVVNLNFGYGGTVQASQVSSLSLDIENGMKPTYTFNGSHDLQFLTPVSRKISGQMDVVFTSLTDSQWGFWDIVQGQIQGSITLTFTHPSGSTTTSPYVQGYAPATTNAGYGVTITLPACNFAKYADSIKMEDVVMTTLNFEAAYPLGAATPQTIQTTIVDGQYLPF